MGRLIKDRYEKRLTAVLAVIIIFSSLFVPIASLLSNKAEYPKEGLTYYSASSDKAVFIAGSINSTESEMLYLSKWFASNGINVVYAQYSDGYEKYEQGLEFLEGQGLKKENTAVIGYDIGGYYLLNHLSEGERKYAGAVLLSPYYKYFDASSITVNDTSYVNNIDWLKAVEPQSFKQPTSIITTTLDDIASPALCTVIYNHISGDDILISSNRYSAIKSGVELNVVSGGNHLIVPHSKAVISNIREFLNENLGWQLNQIGSLPFLSVAFFNALPIALLLFSINIYMFVRFKFTSISYSVSTYRDKKSGGILLGCILGAVAATPISYLLILGICRLNFSNSVQWILLSYIFSFSIVMLAIYKFSPKDKIASAMEDVSLTPPKKSVFLSLALFVFVLGAVVLQSSTDFILKFVFPDLLTFGVTLVMMFLTFYVTGIEADLLRGAKLPGTVNITYYLIKFVPYILLLLWNMFMSKHTAVILYYRYILLFAVALVMGRAIIEISGHRKLSAILMSIMYTVSLLMFSVSFA